jgi:hypothetical protein
MLDALRSIGLPGAERCNVYSYEFGLQVGSKAKVWLVERWYSWDDLNKHLASNIFPHLDTFNALMPEPFDPAKHTASIELLVS